MFFSIFVSQLGPELNSLGLGITLDGVNISALLFADDLVLVGKSRKALDTLMDRTRIFFMRHHLQISDTKSKIMSFDSFTGETIFDNSDALPPLVLESVLSFKYLGVHVSSSPYSLFKCYNENVKRKALSYLASVLSMAKTGPDRSEMAYMAWTRIAVPAILYGAEVIPLTQDTINTIERCQNQVAKFMLQIPQSSSNVSVCIDAGLQPVWSLIAQKVIIYAHNVMKKPDSNWAKKAFKEQVSQGSASPYARYLLRWKSLTNCFNLPVACIKSSVKSAAIKQVKQSQQEVCVTSFAMNTPAKNKEWFKPKPWVSDSSTSKMIAQFRTCNARLGNRGPARNGESYKLCPLCAKSGINALNNEVRAATFGVSHLNQLLFIGAPSF